MWSARLFPGVLLGAPFLFSGGPGSDLTPADSAANSIVAYWLSFGAIAVVALVLFMLFMWPGWLTKKWREEARADLLKENERLTAERAALQAELIELQEYIRSQLVPAVTSFTAVASSLVPLLQTQIQQYREGDRDFRERR